MPPQPLQLRKANLAHSEPPRVFRRDTSPILLAEALVVLAVQACTPLPPRDETPAVLILDTFERPLNDRAIPLVNWDGYMANPAPELTVVPPEDAVYPVQVFLEADHHGLYFDTPSQAGPDGPSKVLFFSNDAPQTFRMGYFPLRGEDEGRHRLRITVNDFDDNESTTTIPIHVQSAAPAADSSDFRVRIDMRRDRDGHRWFTGGRGSVARAAARSWGYFIGGMKLDTVESGDESTFVWDHPRGFHGGSGSEVTNNFEYTGFLVHIYGIRCEGGGNNCNDGDMRSGGQPSTRHDDQVQTSDGTTLQPELWRSGLVDIEMDGNFDHDGWYEALDDTRWFELDTDANDNDLYSVAMHEIGHALAFNEQYEAFPPGGSIDSPAITAYYGGPVDIDGSDHFSNAVDPLSGYGAFGNDYGNDTPQGRWLITKLDLLLLDAVGYTLRDVAALRGMAITTETIPPYTPDQPYRARLRVADGVPPYQWSGHLPRGLSIDSFTGAITGQPVQDAVRITFPVEVCDHDPTTDCVSKRLALHRDDGRDGGDGGGAGGGSGGGPVSPCPPGQVCGEPGTEPGECRICIPEDADPL